MSTPTPDPVLDPTAPAPDPVTLEPAPLRHVSRHLQQSVYVHLRTALADLGWSVAGQVPFGATPFAVQFGRKSEAELARIEPNTAAITFGEEPEQEELELGGGLMLMTSALSVDIVPANEALGLAVADDVKDVLTGRLSGYSRFLTLRDFTADAAGVAAEGYRIEFSEVSRRRNDAVDFRLHWQQVIALVELTMPGWD